MFSQIKLVNSGHVIMDMREKEQIQPEQSPYLQRRRELALRVIFVAEARQEHEQTRT